MLTCVIAIDWKSPMTEVGDVWIWCAVEYYIITVAAQYPVLLFRRVLEATIFLRIRRALTVGLRREVDIEKILDGFFNVYAYEYFLEQG